MDRRKILKITAVLMCVVLLVGVVLNQMGIMKETTAESEVWEYPRPDKTAKYDGGSGTTASPYLIGSAQSLAQMAVNVNDGDIFKKGTTYYFKLSADIDLTGNEWTQPIGDNKNPFQFVFDGNNKTISGLKIPSTANRYVGLFGQINNATISNLNVAGSVESSATYIGGIVGDCQNSKIVSCFFNGTVNGGGCVGGIAGSAAGSTTLINGCYVEGNIQASAEKVGGIVGTLSSKATLVNSKNFAEVTLNVDATPGSNDKPFAGGLTGWMDDSSVVNSWNAGTIRSNRNASGIAAGQSAVIKGCYSRGAAVTTTAGGKAGSISASLDQASQLDGVYAAEQEAAQPFAGDVFTGTSKNVGHVPNYTDDVIRYTDSSMTWDVDNMTLYQALDKFVTDNRKNYNMIWDWMDDASPFPNMHYPVLGEIGHTHNYSKIEIVSEAKCEEGGMIRHYCNVEGCTKYWVEYTEKLDHQYKLTETKVQTCEQEGQRAMVCQRPGCGEIQPGSEQTIPALGHKYRPYTRPALCVTTGYSVNICENCGQEEPGTKQEVPAVGHTYQSNEKPDIIIAPTCTDPEQRMWECVSCYAVKVVTGDAALGHNWEDNYTLDNSTCIHQGGYIKHCKNHWEDREGNTVSCSAIMYNESADGTDETGRFELSSHDYKESGVVDPTCNSEGYTNYACSVCGVTKKDNYTNRLEHVYGEEIQDASCTQAGKIVYTCLNGCGKSYAVDLSDPLPHVYDTEVNRKHETCTESGYVEYQCSNGCTRTSKVPIPSLGGHNYSVEDETLSVKPSCGKPGKKVMKCTNTTEDGWTCTSTSKPEVIPALEHVWQDVETIPPTCLEGGYTLQKCDNCHDERHANIVNPTGEHTWLTREEPPTEEDMGQVIKYCQYGDADEEVIAYIAVLPNANFQVVLTSGDEEATIKINLAATDFDADLMSYSLDRGRTWEETTAVAVELTLEQLEYMKESKDLEVVTSQAAQVMELSNTNEPIGYIQIKRIGSDDEVRSTPILDSPVQEIEVYAAPGQPDFIHTLKPSSEGGKGSVKDLDPTVQYQYRKDGDSKWTNVEVGATVIEDLTPGYYEIRVKADLEKNLLPSDTVTFVIEEYSPEVDPSESEAPGESTKPDPSTKPGESTKPDPSTKPGESAKPGPSTKPGESTKPGPSTKPGESTKPGPSTKPGTSNPPSPSDSGNNNGTNNGGNGTNNGTNNGGNGTNSGTNNSGLNTNVDYYTKSGGATTSTNTVSRVTSAKSAKTGDDSNIALWMTLSGAALAALAVVITKKRRDLEE